MTIDYKVLLVGDVHLADNPPSSCTEDYTDDLFDLLDQVSRIAIEQQVTEVLQGGDFFHIPTPSRTSHSLVLRSIEWAKDIGVPLSIAPGNHDMAQGHRLDSINETQPLGIMFASNAAIDLSYAQSKSGPAYGIPWQQDWEEEGTIERVFGAVPPGVELVVTHAPLYPPGQELPYENIKAKDVAAALANTDVEYVFYSHVHDYHGTYEVDGITFCNNGALSRGSLTESNLSRKVYVTTWSSAKGFSKIEVPHKPGHEIFRVAENQELKDAALKLEEFLDTVGQTTLEVANVESLVSYIKEQDVPSAVKSLAVELLSEV